MEHDLSALGGYETLSLSYAYTMVADLLMQKYADRRLVKPFH